MKITVGELSVVTKYRTDPVHTGLCQPRRNVVDIAIHSGAAARSVRSLSFFLSFSFSFSLTLDVARAGIKRSSLSTRRAAAFARGYYTLRLCTHFRGSLLCDRCARHVDVIATSWLSSAATRFVTRRVPREREPRYAHVGHAMAQRKRQ